MKSKTARIGFNSTHDSYEGDTIMITKIALIAAVTLGTVSVALADGEFDGNRQNRYPQATAFQSSNVALTGGHVVTRGESYIDRASQSWGGGN
jgi:hypothetical protein